MRKKLPRKISALKALPNVLSVARVILSLALLFASSLPLFAVCYIVSGLTDVLDGYLARRFGWQTDLGAKLDSLGDLVFWVVVLYLLYRRTNVYSLPVLLGIGVVALVRLANLVITKRKFGQWGMLHSLGNKLAGLALYWGCLTAFFYGILPWAVWCLLFGLALLTAAEETVYLLRSTQYDPNPKGFFGKMK